MAKLRISYPSLRQPARVTFGRGAIKTVATPDELQDTMFFVSSRNEVRATIAAAFEKQGVRFDLLPLCTKPPGEPTGDMIDEGARFLGSHVPRRIVGIGGGSVMDWCRLAWARQQGLLSADSGSVAAPTHPDARPRFWLVPTTCATGAEAAAVAVYSFDGRKIAAVSDAFVAEHVVLDSQFLERMAPEDLAISLADTLSHAIESYCSIVPNTLAKEAAVSALSLVLEHGSSEQSPCRHERLMEAGYFAGVAASNCSVGVVHAFAHAIARYGVSHAHANAIGLRAGIEVNAESEALQKLTKRVGLCDWRGLIERLTPMMDRAMAGRDHRRLAALLSNERHRLDVIADMRRDVSLRSNPKPLDDGELQGFLDRVLGAISN